VAPTPGESSSIDSCDLCRERRERARVILSEMRKLEFDRSEGLSERLIKDNMPVTGLRSFVSRSSLADDETAKEKKDETVKWGRVWRVSLVSGLVAASLLVLFNFFYYLFLPGSSFIRADDEVRIVRKGFFAGTFETNSRMVLPERDTIRTAMGDNAIKTGRGMKLYIKREGRLQFSRGEESFSARLYNGDFFIIFGKSSGLKRYILLPLECVVEITGTKLYFNTGDEGFRIYLFEGAARLKIPGSRPVDLNPGFLYSLSKGARLKIETQDKFREDRLFDRFRGISGIEKEYSLKFTTPGPGKVHRPVQKRKSAGRMTLKKLKEKYGSLSVLMTREKKRYIGSLRILGKEVQIITVNGTIRVPSSDVEKISPYDK
jgi:hypothetical protein